MIYYAILLERAIPDVCINSLIGVVEHTARMNPLSRGVNAHRMITPYARTDHRRQALCDAFLDHSKDPDDVLVMLDNDHDHPADVVERITRYDPSLGVVAALAYLRGYPHKPIFFTRHEGILMTLPVFDLTGLLQVTIAAPCAIAIRRWVLQTLRDAGEQTFWKYVYDDPKRPWWGEDMYFGELCEKHGIHHYVDLETISYHWTNQRIGPEDWHPEITIEEKENGK